MNFNSIITKISLAFFITTVLFIVVFFAYGEYEKKQFIQTVNTKYTEISNNIHHNRMSIQEMQKYLKPLNIVLQKNPQEFIDESVMFSSGKGFEILEYKDKIYFHFRTPHFRVMFRDENIYTQNYAKFVVFTLVFVLFVFIYYLIIKNIKATKLLLESRQLFLRTLMHELKTPIAKGRIVSELIDDAKQKSRIITIFEKLNHLIDDFAKVEQLVSKNYAPKIHKYSVDKIVENGIDMLMLESTENIKIQKFSQTNIEADFELLSMAVKNIVDNGLKYSKDHQISIQEMENELIFISSGEKLKNQLQEYFKPFHNDIGSRNHGMGLGLYIVKSILDLHSFSLDYEYKNEQNIFIFRF